MNRKQWLVWVVAGFVWLLFMGPRLLVLHHGNQATQHQALVTLGVFSVIVAVVAAGVSRFLRSPPERRNSPRQTSTARKATQQQSLDQTRTTDLLGPGAASRRATRAVQERRRRAAS